MKKQAYFVVYSLQMANFLCRHGFDIVKISDSEKDPRFKVCLFLDSPKLQKTMKAYKREGRC